MNKTHRGKICNEIIVLRNKNKRLNETLIETSNARTRIKIESLIYQNRTRIRLLIAISKDN